MSEHLPRHLLEALLADAAQLPQAPELRAHLATCAHCSERLRNMQSARAAFAVDHNASDFARRVTATTAARRPTSRRSYGAAAFGTLALAAVVLLFRDPTGSGIRYRGAAVSLQAYVRTGTGARALQDGELLQAGGQLAFTYTLSEPQYLLLFGVDDAGTITRYFPDGNIVQSSALSACAQRQLPVGIELDARPGRERLVALFSARPLAEAAARSALESAWRELRARGRGLDEPFELGLPAKQISLWFDKQ